MWLQSDVPLSRQRCLWEELQRRQRCHNGPNIIPATPQGEMKPPLSRFWWNLSAFSGTPSGLREKIAVVFWIKSRNTTNSLVIGQQKLSSFWVYLFKCLWLRSWPAYTSPVWLVCNQVIFVLSNSTAAWALQESGLGPFWEKREEGRIHSQKARAGQCPGAWGVLFSFKMGTSWLLRYGIWTPRVPWNDSEKGEGRAAGTGHTAWRSYTVENDDIILWGPLLGLGPSGEDRGGCRYSPPGLRLLESNRLE